MGFADTLMLGKFGTIEMSAASFGNAVFFQLSIFGIGLLYAVGTLISIVDGEKEAFKSILIFKSSIVVVVIISIITYLLNLVLLEHISIFGQTEQVSLLGGQYLKIVNYSTPIIFLFYCGKQMMDGLSQTKIAMYITFLGLVLNVFFNWVLIFGNLGFSKMGLEGAAWATNISRFIMTILMLSAAWFHPMTKQFKKMQLPKKSYVIEIFKLGIPIGLTFFFEIAAFSLGLIMAGWVSENSLAAHQISINLASITYMFITGLAAATTIIIGNFYGAKDLQGIIRTAKLSFWVTIGIELVFALLMILFFMQIPLVYTKDAEVILIAQSLIILAAFFQVSDGLQAVGAAVLRGIKDTKITSFIAFISYGIIMIPGAYYLGFVKKTGVEGIWYAFIIGLTFAAIVLLLRFYYKIKNKLIVFENV